MPGRGTDAHLLALSLPSFRCIAASSRQRATIRRCLVRRAPLRPYAWAQHGAKRLAAAWFGVPVFAAPARVAAANRAAARDAAKRLVSTNRLVLSRRTTIRLGGEEAFRCIVAALIRHFGGAQPAVRGGDAARTPPCFGSHRGATSGTRSCFRRLVADMLGCPSPPRIVVLT